MKKGTIIALIVAVAMIIAGGIILTLGLSFAGEPENTVTVKEKIYVVNDPFDSIQVKTADCDVTIVKSAGEFQMVGQETDKVSYSVLVEDGVLKIDVIDLQKWYDHIGIFRENVKITLRLPERQYESLRVQTDTGDITVPQGFTFAAAELFSDTGDITVAAAVTDRIISSTVTGDIHLQGSAPAMVNLETDTGDVDVVAVSNGELHIKTDTGSMELETVKCKSLTCKSDTGDIELNRVIAEDYLQAFNDTGDVTLTDCDAGELNIETDTGDIYGVLLSAKIFWGDSDTGNMKVPDSTMGGRCRVQSSSGDIEFFYKNNVPDWQKS